MMRIIFLALILLITGGCTGPSMAPNKPSRDQANKTLPAQEGVVLDIQQVSIEGDARKAQMVGAGVGGVIANEATKSTGGVTRTIATAAGAAAGAMAGDQASKTVLANDGEEVVIELSSGRLVSVIQEPGEVRLARGQLVWVVEGGGKTRVFPRSEK